MTAAISSWVRFHIINIPITYFGLALATSAQASLWRGWLSASFFHDVEPLFSAMNWICWLTGSTALVTLLPLYLLKCYLWWGVVKLEIAHPIRSNFVFSIVLSAALLIMAWPRAIDDPPSRQIFYVLAAVQMTLNLWMYGRWINNADNSMLNSNPIYLMAVVGNFVVGSLGTRKVEPPNVVCRQIALFLFAFGALVTMVIFLQSVENIAYSFYVKGRRRQRREAKLKSAYEASCRSGGVRSSSGGGGGGGGIEQGALHSTPTLTPRPTTSTTTAAAAAAGGGGSGRGRGGGGDGDNHQPEGDQVELEESLNKPRFQLTPDRSPMYFLLMTPFTTATLAWGGIAGECDTFCNVLFFISFSMFLLIMAHARMFIGIPYSLACWSYTFPITALANACLVYSEMIQCVEIAVIALGLAVFSAVAVAGVLWSALLTYQWKWVLPPDPILHGTVYSLASRLSKERAQQEVDTHGRTCTCTEADCAAAATAGASVSEIV